MKNTQLGHKLRTIFGQTCSTTYLVLLLGSTALIGSLILAIALIEQPGSMLTDDPAAITNQPFYLGAFAHLGILLWCATATISFFTFALLKDVVNQSQSRRFFLSSGMITILLLLDDLFLLHENVLPNIFGIPQKLVYVIYAIIVAFYLIKFSKLIFKTNFIPLLLALALFAISIFNDQLTFFAEYNKDLHTVVEDGSKLLGIYCWLIYFAVGSLDKLKTINFHQIESRQKALR